MDEECDGHRVQPEQGCEALPQHLTVLGASPDPVCIMSAGKLYCLHIFLPICLHICQYICLHICLHICLACHSTWGACLNLR